MLSYVGIYSIFHSMNIAVTPFKFALAFQHRLVALVNTETLARFTCFLQLSIEADAEAARNLMYI